MHFESFESFIMFQYLFCLITAIVIVKYKPLIGALCAILYCDFLRLLVISEAKDLGLIFLNINKKIVLNDVGWYKYTESLLMGTLFFLVIILLWDTFKVHKFTCKYYFGSENTDKEILRIELSKILKIQKIEDIRSRVIIFICGLISLLCWAFCFGVFFQLSQYGNLFIAYVSLLFSAVFINDSVFPYSNKTNVQKVIEIDL